MGPSAVAAAGWSALMKMPLAVEDLAVGPLHIASAMFRLATVVIPELRPLPLLMQPITAVLLRRSAPWVRSRLLLQLLLLRLQPMAAVALLQRSVQWFQLRLLLLLARVQSVAAVALLRRSASSIATGRTTGGSWPPVAAMVRRCALWQQLSRRSRAL